MCPRSSDPFYIVSYYIKRVTTSWTHSNKLKMFSRIYAVRSVQRTESGMDPAINGRSRKANNFLLTKQIIPTVAINFDSIPSSNLLKFRYKLYKQKKGRIRS